MKRVLILHGTNGNPKENWFFWLSIELEKNGFKTWVPELPHSEKPNIRRYNKFLFSRRDWDFTDSILVGHSSGAVAILGLLQNLPDSITVDTCYLVGAFKDDLGWESLKELFEEPFDFEKIKKKARKFVFIHSDNDPHCPLEAARFLADKLGGELIIKKGQGHFNIAASPRYKTFPFLLTLIEENAG